ncbi:hypothetical protein F477_03652 [Pseudomonas sp. URIL14HWK12:I3]|uniref:hypothetical protein n=1 Tax=unclassified Pseudomonas TaxID=196821 RepID=UPI000DADFF57|nr:MULTISPECIES: hypothetical protein [unclassified Pseudomonas]PZW52806.1 hypothetical protein F478_02601 [Pseudomonas sp. URIL14HWK12:I2]PZW53551.1 hypothetical protein F477_03652 [Pseudomonas sp. URIL14HWK12:I3]
MTSIPEGTQFIESGCGEKGFRKFEKGCWWFFEDFWRHVDWKMGDLTPVFNHPDYVAPVQPWNGQGLPPVGTVCEFAGFNPEETLPSDPMIGDRVTVIAHFKSGSIDVAAFTFSAPPDFEYLKVAQGAYGCFRPVRTPEQIAEEERERAVKKILDVMLGHDQACIHDDTVQALCAKRIYDAGYRKQEAL